MIQLLVDLMLSIHCVKSLMLKG